MHVTIDELLDHLGEERAKWREWFSVHGDAALGIALSNETHPSVGALVLHCFWAELFYAHLVRGETLTRESDIVQQNRDLPDDQADAVFAFGQCAHDAMRMFADRAGDEEWERLHEIDGPGIRIEGSARKLVSHILVHEIRHWAQIAMVMRQNGLAPPGDHDLIFSDSFGVVVERQ